MPAARYAQRVEHLARMFGILLLHPAGLAIDDLARELGTSAAELRADLVVFMNRELPVELDWALVGDLGLEFLGAQGEQTESRDAARVRLTSDAPLAELGVAMLSAQQLGPLVRAAADLLAVEPDNEALRGALDRLTRTLMAGVEASQPYGATVAATLRRAVEEHRRVRIEYARAWRPGVSTRVVEPYRVVSTRRGFEVDAGPLDDTGALRTFLVSGIRSCEVLVETFVPPSDVAERIAESRSTTPVRLVVPRDLAWVVDRLAESVTVTRADEDLEVLADVLPPVADRVGLLLAVAGPDAFVVEPTELADVGATTAHRLLEHHGLV
jgi:proteasome accessory factor C